MNDLLMKSHQEAILTAAETVAVEGLTAVAGPSLEALMAAAGTAVCREVVQTFSPQRAIVLCGPGRNGADGYLTARLLRAAGWNIEIVADPCVVDVSSLAQKQKILWDGIIRPLSPTALESCDLVVDALFGIGLQRPLEKAYRETVDALNTLGLPCISIDMPSGIHTDTGEVMGTAVRALKTVTFGYLKPGHVLLPGRIFCGQIVIADIGFSKPALDDCSLFVNRPGLWRDKLPEPALQSHKYKRGHLQVLGGSNITGAARLACYSARRIGAGMVTVACREEVRMIYGLSSAGLLIAPLNKQNSFVDFLKEKSKTAALLGPGAGVTQATRKAVLATLKASIPSVLDADALTVFKDNPQALFRAIQAPCVLTPHEGEFAQLFCAGGHKISRARQAASQCGAVIVLKGADTVIAHPSGLAVVQNHAPATLATAGTGDVLAGMIAGLLAQGIEPFAAACMAAWIHGEAANQFGIGLIAEDLADLIPGVLRHIAKGAATI